MLDKVFELETKHDLKKVKIGKLCVWPFLRIYFGYKLTYNVSSAVINLQTFRSILFTLFSGFTHLFSGYDFLFFSDSEQRRKIGEKYVDRFDFVTPIIGGRSLFFEILFITNHSTNSIPTQFRTSKSILYALEYICIKLLVFKRIRAREVLDQIKADYGLTVDYHYFGRRFYAQYLIGITLARLYRPKAVFFITPYNNLGYLVGFKKHGIKVVEMQHGVINKHHLGYNPSIDFGSLYQPDHLLTFGRRELEVFKGGNCYIQSSEVYPVGNFYFDYLVNEYGGDEKIRTLSKNFEKVIAVSAEFDIEGEIIQFMNKVASKLNHFLFLYMPRNKKAIDYKDYQFEPNIVITDWLNSYQVIRQSDFHTCVRSTTALEAVALGTQNVLINLKNYAESYFKDTLTDNRITLFVNTEEEYVQALTTFPSLPKEEVMRSDNNIIAPNFKDNLQRVLHKIITS